MNNEAHIYMILNILYDLCNEIEYYKYIVINKISLLDDDTTAFEETEFLTELYDEIFDFSNKIEEYYDL